jgi:hypothetical protein
MRYPGLSGPEIRQIFARVADALSDTKPPRLRYFADVNATLGQKIAAAWEDGVTHAAASPSP